MNIIKVSNFGMETQYKVDNMKSKIIRYCENTECDSACELYIKCINKVQEKNGYSPKVNLLKDWNLKEIIESYNILKKGGI